ncbi:MAG: STN domain-containing protein, partial [Planctomycetes bacterium]|nr:STN domain-containing protein [Planctomycetota bacterium]
MRRTSTWLVIASLMAGVVGIGIGANEKPLIEKPAAAPLPPDVEKPVVSAAVPAVKIDPKIAQMLVDLGSDDYRTREKAGRDLAALGEKALPGMKSTLLSTDNPEVQRRLIVLVRKMEVERLVSPKRVTMSVKQKTVKDTLDELAKMTGYKIEFNGNMGNGEPKHDFEFENTPFWVAIDKVAAAAGCIVVAEYDDETIRVYNQDTMNPYVAYAGPFRFLATNIHSNKSVQLSGINRRGGGMNRNENMSLQFQIQSEPKNPMLGVTQAEVISAVDENGASLLPPKDPNNFRQAFYE